MNKNVGNVDRAIRVILGLVIVGLGVYFASWWGIVGIVLILTGLAGWCPLYKALGINTHNDPKLHKGA